MRYLFAGRFVWFGQVCAGFKWNEHDVYILLFCKWINDMQITGGFNGWKSKEKGKANEQSVKELRYIEILKSFRFQLQFVLRKVCDPGVAQGKVLKSKRLRTGQAISNKLNNALKVALNEILEKYNIKESEFIVKVLESTQPMISKLSETLRIEINNLHKGILPQISNSLPKGFSKKSCLKFFSELYNSNLNLLIRLIQPYLLIKRKISFDSEEFTRLSQKLESKSLSNKLLLYQKYGLLELDVPAGIVLSRVLEEYSVESKDFLSEIIEIEEDFKSMIEVLFSLVKL